MEESAPAKANEGAEPRRPGGRQYILELISELEDLEPSLLRGRNRFPKENELSLAPAQFRSIMAIAQKLAGANWGQLSAEIRKGVEYAMIELISVVNAIFARPEGQASRGEEAETAARDLAIRLEKIQRYFSNTVEPALAEVTPPETPIKPGLTDEGAAEVRQIKDELQASRAELADLRAQNAQISAELEARNELVEATRVDTGSAGAHELSAAYVEQADLHERQWKIWGIGLGVSSVVALVVGYIVLKINKPDDHATAAQIVSHVAIDLLVVGLLIYIVRVTSLQFSVHRHLAAVASNKAAALSTFAQIVSTGFSAETRDRLAEVLAHHVFVSDNTGFLDSASDQVTLPERIAGPVAQRISGS